MRWTISHMVGKEHLGKTEVHSVRKGLEERQKEEKDMFF